MTVEQSIDPIENQPSAIEIKKPKRIVAKVYDVLYPRRSDLLYGLKVIINKNFKVCDLAILKGHELKSLHINPSPAENEYIELLLSHSNNLTTNNLINYALLMSEVSPLRVTDDHFLIQENQMINWPYMNG